MPNKIEYATPPTTRRSSPILFWLLYFACGIASGFLMDVLLHYLWAKRSDGGGVCIAYAVLVLVAAVRFIATIGSDSRNPMVPLHGAIIGTLVPPVVFAILIAL